MTLTSLESVRGLEDRQWETQHEIRRFGKHVQQGWEQMQIHQKQRDAYIDTSLVQMHMEQRRNLAALRDSFTTSLQPLLAQIGQTTLAPDQNSQMRQYLVDNARMASTIKRQLETARLCASLQLQRHNSARVVVGVSATLIRQCVPPHGSDLCLASSYGLTIRQFR